MLPFFLGTLSLVFLRWRRRGAVPGADIPRWAIPVVGALAILPGDVLVRAGPPPLWPVAGADRVVHAAAVLMLLAIAESQVRARSAVAFALRALAAGAAFWITLGVRIPAFWTVAEGVAWIGAFALAAVAIVTALERAPRVEAGAVLLLCSGGAAAVLVGSGSTHLAQLAGGVGAALGAMMVVWLIAGPFNTGGGVGVCAMLLATLLLCGHYYAGDGIPLAQTLCVALAPLAVLVGRLPRLARLRPWKRWAVVAVVGALPVAAAAGMAIAGAKSEPAGYAE